MLKGSELSKSFGGDTLFSNLSFTIGSKERWGLVGRNGSGKSTLMQMITGSVAADHGSCTTARGYRIGYLEQRIQFTQPTIREEAALGLPEEREFEVWEAERILDGLGIDGEKLDDSPSTLSGGFALRLQLAKVLLSEPDCLLLDEPTNYLDIASIQWLEQELTRWRRELLLVTHDRLFMERTCTHTMGIHRGKLFTVKGGPVELYDKILLQENAYEATRKKLDKQKAHMQHFVDRFSAKASKAKQAQGRLKAISKLPQLEELMALENLNFSFPFQEHPGKKLLEAHNLSFAYEEGEPLITDCSLRIEKEDRIAIIGKNGRGKSTLLRLLQGDLNAQQGSLKQSPNLQIGYFGQTHIDRLNPALTIEEQIAAANPELPYGSVRALCGLMLFSGDKAKKRIDVLSGGERSRVLLGTIMARPTNLLLLDEPTHHLDIESVEALEKALENYPGAVVLVSHSELLLNQIGFESFVVCREAGQQLFLGSYEDFLEREGWEESAEKEQSSSALATDGKLTFEQQKRNRREAERITRTIKRLEQELDDLQHQAMQIGITAKEAQDCATKTAKVEEELLSLYEEQEQLADR